MTSLVKANLLILLALFPLPCWPQIRWPTIQPLREEHTFVLALNDTSDTPLTLFLKGLKGTSVYKLECHNGNYEDSSEIEFSGDFQCALFAVQGGERTSWNLLATDEPQQQKSDWLNRGRMTSGQLWGECGRNPDYGTIRRFRLRGMEITVQYKDLKWFPAIDSRHPLAGFTVNITAVPNPAAQTPTTERVPAPRPQSCN